MNKGSFGTLRLSSDSVQKIREVLPPKSVDSNPAWLLIGGQVPTLSHFLNNFLNKVF